MMARLQPGVTRAQAQARMDPVYQQTVVDSWKADPASPQHAISAGTPTVYPHLLLSPVPVVIDGTGVPWNCS